MEQMIGKIDKGCTEGRDEEIVKKEAEKGGYSGNVG